MNKAQALEKWAEVYAKVIEKSAPGACQKTAVEFGVMDMTNQTKRMSDVDAAFMINDDAEWMMEKMA